MDLFGSGKEELSPGLVLLRRFADSAALAPLIADITAAAPFRHQMTPGGKPMGAANSNCGPLGWIADRRGYGYSPADPLTGHPWPPMPDAFQTLAYKAAEIAGWPGFKPDACLLNRYAPGVGMGLHVDRDEVDPRWPIVSVSLGLPGRFSIRTGGKLLPVPLEDGDVLVFGGVLRRAEHKTLPVKPGVHPIFGSFRLNLTFRRAV